MDDFITNGIESAERLITRSELRKSIAVSGMTIWRWEQAGVFPEHLSINGRNYWLESEVLNWIDDQKARRTSKSMEVGHDAR